MRLLLDTHTVIWTVQEAAKLSFAANAAIADPNNVLLVSAASLWEMTIKIGLGKLIVDGSTVQSIFRGLGPFGIQVLPIRPLHLLALERLPFHHRDPFDRILIAQSQSENIPLLSADREIKRYEVNVLW